MWLSSGRSFNQTMIAEGYADEYTYDTPYRYQHVYQQAETEARLGRPRPLGAGRLLLSRRTRWRSHGVLAPNVTSLR